MTKQEILDALAIDKSNPEAVNGAVSALQALLTNTGAWPPPPPPPPGLCGSQVDGESDK